MPGHADHQAAVMAPVGRPPVLAVGHQLGEVRLQRLEVELLHFLAVVEALERVGLAVMLVQDVEVQRSSATTPSTELPGHRDRAVHDRALAAAGALLLVHLTL